MAVHNEHRIMVLPHTSHTICWFCHLPYLPIIFQTHRIMEQVSKNVPKMPRDDNAVQG